MSKSEKTILVVEDNAELRNLIMLKLSREGYGVQGTGKAPEARAKLLNQKYSLVLLDLRLQHGSGESIIEWLRADKQAPNHHTPILVMSGHLDNELIGRFANQINGALLKPVEGEELIHRVKALIGE